MKRSTKKGFTIVELVIVIAIIAILAAVLIPTFASLIQKANESNDIQAAKNMNTFLAAANVTGDVKSILDVYDVFEDSGFAVENYTPLYKNRYYYYDKEYNQILYVDDKLNVIYPTEHKGETSTGRTWMSLSMSAPTGTRPKDTNFIEPTNENKTMTATVTNAAEYAYVIDAYNRADAGVSLDLTINGEIDMMGACCIIKKPQGAITIKGAENSTAVIKNVTSNYCDYSTDNVQNINSAYWTSALIGETSHSVTINNITFANLNVKNVYAGCVSLLVGQMNEVPGNKLTVNGVTIKDSTLIGHRSVGAVCGQIDADVAIDTLTLTNTSVQTVGGRSAMILGTVARGYDVDIKGFANNNSSFGIYENKGSEQVIKNNANETDPKIATYEDPAGDNVKYITSVKVNMEANNVTKTLVTYGYKEGALVFLYGKDSTNAKVYTAENFTNGGLSISK